MLLRKSVVFFYLPFLSECIVHENPRNFFLHRVEDYLRTTVVHLL